MFRRSLLSASACLVICLPALAAETRLTGLAGVGYDYLNLDGPSSDDANVYHGSGSALWTWPGLWSAQADYGFASYRFDGHFTVDQMNIGGGFFWRDSNDGAIGGMLHYQSLDDGVENDGISIAAVGEKYFDQATLAGYIGHSDFGGPDISIRGWQLGAKGSYYADESLAFRLGLNYGSWRAGGDDAKEWNLDGEAEYLIPDSAASVYAGLGFGSVNPDHDDSTDTFQLGVGVRVHFGTQGTLMDRNRAEPLQPVATSRLVF